MPQDVQAELFALGPKRIRQGLDRGDFTSERLVQALRTRSEAINPHINAWTHPRWDQALEEARQADREQNEGNARGPLHGIPFSCKENLDLAGMASTLGVRKRLDHRATEDAVVIKLARSLGAILIGKTNVPQTLLSPLETSNSIWGTTSNPWNLQHVPGGSSGGEAAAIAAGLSPWGFGTDIGGSIRIPAAYCGIVGLKPTFYRWSNRGSQTMVPGQEVIRAQVGPMARTTEDLAWLIQHLTTHAQSALDPLVPPLGPPDLGATSIDSLRIGYYEEDGFFSPTRSMRRAVRRAAEALQQAGAELVEYAPPRASDLTYLYFAALSSDAGRTLEQGLGDEPMIEPLKLLRRMVKLPGFVRLPLVQVLKAQGEGRVAQLVRMLGRKDVERLWALTAERSSAQQREFAAWDELNLDALITPAHVTPAPPHGMTHDFTIGFCYAARYNTLNMPAGTVPVGRVSEDEAQPRMGPLRDRWDRRASAIEARSSGLPTAIQVVARPWREDVALKVMLALENQLQGAADYPKTPVAP